MILADALVNCLGASCETGLPRVEANNKNFQAGLQIVFGIVAAMAVLVIIIAAIRLTSSQGNPQEATKARQAIIYAVAGLVVALGAEAFVTFVLNSL
jgi:uncharacterized membrane protein SpoIIM required for sporulation